MVRSTTWLVGSATEVRIGVGLPTALIGSGCIIASAGMDVAAQVEAMTSAAVAQVDAGANLVEVFSSPPDEVTVLPRIVAAVGGAVAVPLCIRVVDATALDAALAACPGKAVAELSSVPAAHLPLALAAARRYGAAVIVPSVTGENKFASLEEQIELARTQDRETIVNRIPRDDVIIGLSLVPEAKYPGSAAVVLALAAHVSKVDGVNLALRPSESTSGMLSEEIFAGQLIARAVATGVTCVLADGHSARRSVSTADSLVIPADATAR